MSAKIKGRAPLRSAKQKKPEPQGEPPTRMAVHWPHPGQPRLIGCYFDDFRAPLFYKHAPLCEREMEWGDIEQPKPPVPPPLCKDCKHAGQRNSTYTPCNAGIGGKRSLETGAWETPYTVASVNRDHEHLCGREGKYFEPKPKPEIEAGTIVVVDRMPIPQMRPWWAFWRAA